MAFDLSSTDEMVYSQEKTMKNNPLKWCALAGSSVIALAAAGCVEHERTVYVEEHPRPAVQREVVVQQAPPQREIIVQQAPPQREVVVVEPPPQARVEVIPARQPGYYWVPGHYIHNGRQYVWVSGRYERPPREGVQWEAGRWDRRGNGYVWIEGRWR